MQRVDRFLGKSIISLFFGRKKKQIVFLISTFRCERNDSPIVSTSHGSTPTHPTDSKLGQRVKHKKRKKKLKLQKTRHGRLRAKQSKENKKEILVKEGMDAR